MIGGAIRLYFAAMIHHHDASRQQLHLPRWATLISLFFVSLLSSGGCRTAPSATPAAPLSGTTAVAATTTAAIPPPPTPEAATAVATSSLLSSVPLPTSTPAPTPTPIVYQVQAGDTLLAIAIAQGTTTEAIVALNPAINPDFLQIGQQIVLPQPPTPAAPAASAGNSVDPSTLPAAVTQLNLYQTPLEGVWLVGEVTNEGTQPLENVQVTLALAADETAATTQSISAWTAVSVILPGRSAPFGVLIPEPMDTLPQVSPRISGGQPVVDLGNRYLTLDVTDTAVAHEGAQTAVSGTVQNVGDATAVQIMLVAAFYDNANRLIGYSQMALPQPLAAGQATPFTMQTALPGSQATHAIVTAQALSEADNE